MNCKNKPEVEHARRFTFLRIFHNALENSQIFLTVSQSHSKTGHDFCSPKRCSLLSGSTHREGLIEADR